MMQDFHCKCFLNESIRDALIQDVYADFEWVLFVKFYFKWKMFEMKFKTTVKSYLPILRIVIVIIILFWVNKWLIRISLSCSFQVCISIFIIFCGWIYVIVPIMYYYNNQGIIIWNLHHHNIEQLFSSVFPSAWCLKLKHTEYKIRYDCFTFIFQHFLLIHSNNWFWSGFDFPFLFT